MYEKILVPLDGSPLAEVALPYAGELALRLASRLVLFQAVPRAYHIFAAETGATPVPYSEREMEPLKDQSSAYLEQVALGLKEKGITSVETVAVLGDPATEIVEYADRLDVGLIVIATHGRSGLGRWVLGSVADKVLRATTRPIALIRAREDRAAVRQKDILDRILLALDGSRESEAVIPYVDELASRLKASVTIFQALPRTFRIYAAGESYAQVDYSEKEIQSMVTGTEGYLERIARPLRARGTTVTTVVRVGPAAEEIIKLAAELESDLVAMSTHGHSGVGRWVFGSVADKILHAGSTPVLLVRVSQSPTVNPA